MSRDEAIPQELMLALLCGNEYERDEAARQLIERGVVVTDEAGNVIWPPEKVERKVVAKLRQYTHHLPGCRLVRYVTDYGRCDCGLDAALAEVQAL